MRKPRTKKAMLDYLNTHERYSTMNSWNGNSSYSRCIKVTRPYVSERAAKQGVTVGQMLDLLDVEDAFQPLDDLMDDFAREHDWRYQIGRNGRSGGYLVLYTGHRKLSDYKSYCQACGQRNYTAVWTMPDPATPQDRLFAYWLGHAEMVPSNYQPQPEVAALGLAAEDVEQLVRGYREHRRWMSLDNRCGRCGANRRVNHTFYDVVTDTTGIARPEDDATISDLRYDTDIVWAFDRAVDEIVDAFISVAKHYEIGTETYTVERERKVLVER